MAAHRAPNLPGEDKVSARLICLIGFSVGWIAWLILRGLQQPLGVDDLSTYPGGITLILGALRIADSGASAVVASPVTKET